MPSQQPQQSTINNQHQTNIQSNQHYVLESTDSVWDLQEQTTKGKEHVQVHSYWTQCVWGTLRTIQTSDREANQEDDKMNHIHTNVDHISRTHLRSFVVAATTDVNLIKQKHQLR